MAFARRSDSKTSRAAANSVDRKRQLSLQDRIYNDLANNGPATIPEIADSLQHPEENVWKRTGELYQLGLIVSTSYTRNLTNRQPALIWRISKPKERAYVQAYRRKGMATPEPVLIDLLDEARRNVALAEVFKTLPFALRKRIAAYERKRLLLTEGKDLGIVAFMKRYPL